MLEAVVVLAEVGELDGDQARAEARGVEGLGGFGFGGARGAGEGGSAGQGGKLGVGGAELGFECGYASDQVGGAGRGVVCLGWRGGGEGESGRGWVGHFAP